MRRTNVVKLVVDKTIHEKLKELAIVTAKCWNEVNWIRMKQLKQEGRIDFLKTEKEVYEKYKYMLKANSQVISRKNSEAWKSFFSLVRKKNEEKLPKSFKLRPPGYWDFTNRNYKLKILIRNDRYKLDEENRIIYLKDFKLALRFKGKLRWHGKQGRLEIIYDEARRSWYAWIPMKVEQERIYKGNLRASVKLGINNLATVYVEDGTWYLFKGGTVLSQYEYYSKKINLIKKTLTRHKRSWSKKLKLVYDKRSRFLRHVINSMINQIMKELKEKGVREVIVGYPKEIKKNNNKLTENFWTYGYILKRFEEKGEELGIKITKVEEFYTSKVCSLCGDIHINGYIEPGLFKCSDIEKVLNADLNSTIRMLHIPKSPRTESYSLSVRDRGSGLKIQPVVYHWTNGSGWKLSTPMK